MFHSSYIQMCFVFTRIVETEPLTNTIFFILLLGNVCFLPTITMMSEEGKETSDYPTSPFPSVSSFWEWIIGSYREVTWVRKYMIGFLGHLCFLEHHCLLSAFEASSGPMENVASQGCWLPCYSVEDITHLPCIHFESCWISATLGPPEFEKQQQ